jgi:MFS family permease
LAVPLEKQLERWLSAGVLDVGTAARIRAFEQSQAPSERLRWPVLLALALGGLLLCAGVLLFVSAHWDELSPAWRFSLVLSLVAAFPAAGASTAERFPALAITFYAIGTACVGAGVFLAAQIFNLQEHWPNGILLWAIGALAGWLLLRNWTQAALLALLVPAWLVGEWEVRTGGLQVSGRLMSEGLLLLAITYFTARTGEEDSSVRRALVWLGGIALLPLSILAFVERHEQWWWMSPAHVSTPLLVIGWAIAICAPLALALILRGKAAWVNVIAMIWVLMIGTFSPVHSGMTDTLAAYAWNSVGIYFWAGVGALGLVIWGLLERHRERINLGVVGFALAVLIFYFSDVMDKLGRSASLIGMGVLLLVGGWILERARRQLIARIQRSAA